MKTRLGILLSIFGLLALAAFADAGRSTSAATSQSLANTSNFCLNDTASGCVPSVLAPSYSATTNLNFTTAPVVDLSITGNLTLTTSNLAAGRSLLVFIAADGNQRTLTFPGTWKFIGSSAPANIAASKTGALSLFAKGSADSTVVASWAVQP